MNPGTNSFLGRLRKTGDKTMKRILLRVAISIFTFGLGVGISMLWQEYAYRSEARRVSSAPSGLPLQLLYVDACGGSGNTQTYDLSTGGQVSVSCVYFTSEAAADGLLQDISGFNPDVVEWSENLDGRGRPIGRTLVIKGAKVLRLSTYGKAYCQTRASSLEDLRWYDEYGPR
jgi:hypothetical protein